MKWLKSIRCEKYAQAFFDVGCDSMEALRHLTSDDLDQFGVKPFHKRVMLERLKHMTEAVPSKANADVGMRS
jgi:hypothetical protein